jgi:alpha-N-arabinofuranosidase
MIPIVQSDNGVALAGPRRARRQSGGPSTSLVLLSLAVAAISAHGSGTVRAQAPARASVTIDAGSIQGTISPLLYGQFLEFMFEGIKSGLTAELIRDRGFEAAPNAIGLPRDWNRYPDDRNDDYGLNFHWDDAVAYPVATDYLEARPAQHALRVDVGTGVIERRGIYQSRFPVRPDVTYDGYLWLKTTDYVGAVTVALEADISGGEIYAEAEIGDVAGDWRRYAFTLRPKRGDPLARLAILFPGTGRVWLDQVSLVPGDARDGVRSDVLERIQALEPSFLRWPGGNVAQDYHWIWGVGPRDRRPTWSNLSWKNEPEPGDFGTDEYIALSRRVGAEPTLTINVEGRGATAEEAAAWVEYCNGPVTSRHGALRAAHGHPEPYGVKYWEIGNEIWGDWVRGHSDAETYARNYKRYYDAMRAVDPTIRFIAVGDNDMKWNRTVLRAVGRYIDYLAIHHYYGRKPMAGDVRNLMARPLFYQQFYDQVAALIAEEVPGRPIRLAINEWGLDLPESMQYSMQAALYGARLMNVFERSSPLVAMSAVSDLVNGWPGGIIQASRHGLFVSPLYHVNRMYSSHRGAERLHSEVDGPTFDSTAEGRDVPVLDVVASRSADNRKIFLKFVNTDLARDLEVAVRLRGARVRTRAERVLLTADSLTARTSFRAPEAIRPERDSIQAGEAFALRLPKHSVAVVTLEVAQAVQ